jgi:GNAT superfamily N-acetyltransferase
MRHAIYFARRASQKVNQMHIEKATAADVPALSDLLSVLFSQEAEFRPNAAAQQKGLAQIINNPDIGTVLVARQGDQVVAMVNLLFTISTALGERVALLEDMVVSPAGRGTGVGTKLISEAISFARAQGCKRITLLTDRSNEAAQRFYAKQGFVVSSMVPMRVSLA